MENEKEKFLAYLQVQTSGETNMFDIRAVRALALEMCDIELSREDVSYIMNNYSELREKYRE